jgi:hypothetical protein
MNGLQPLTLGWCLAVSPASVWRRFCNLRQPLGISPGNFQSYRDLESDKMEFLTNLTIAAVHSGGLVNDAMIQHLPTHARKMEDNTTIARMDTDPSALAAASGRPPLTFRNFVRQHRSAFGAVTANA